MRALRDEALTRCRAAALDVGAEHQRAERRRRFAHEVVVRPLEEVRRREPIASTGALQRRAQAPRDALSPGRREVRRGHGRPPRRASATSSTRARAPTRRAGAPSPSANRARSACGHARAVRGAPSARCGRESCPSRAPGHVVRQVEQDGAVRLEAARGEGRREADRVEARAARHALIGGRGVVPPLADHVPARREGGLEDLRDQLRARGLVEEHLGQRRDVARGRIEEQRRGCARPPPSRPARGRGGRRAPPRGAARRADAACVLLPQPSTPSRTRNTPAAVADLARLRGRTSHPCEQAVDHLLERRIALPRSSRISWIARLTLLWLRSPNARPISASGRAVAR